MSTGPLPLPAFEFEAPGAWQSVDLISDLHLSESAPKTFDAWARHLQSTDADAVFMLGDLFEVWVGDDARTLPFERRCVDVLQQAGRRLQLGFMAGNRDFLVGADLLAQCNILALPDPTLLRAWGQRLLLTHGDALCLEDIDYQRFRHKVRSPAWQEAFLARPLVERVAVAAQMRAASQAHRHGRPDPSLWADVDRPSALAWLHAAGATDMVHGHTHRPGSELLAPGRHRHVLSDWDLEATPPRADVLRLSRAGLVRVAPSTGA